MAMTSSPLRALRTAAGHFLLLAGCAAPSGVILAADSIPDALIFPEVSDAEPGSIVTSAAQTVGGIDVPVPVTIKGGAYSVDGRAYTAADGTVGSGSVIRVQVTASNAFADRVSATLSIGTPASAGLFKVLTRAADITADPLTFTAVAEAPFDTAFTSVPVQVSGIDGAVPVAVQNGSYGIDGGPFTTAPGTVSAGAMLRLRGVSADRAFVTTTVAVRVGNTLGRFSIQTVKTPDTTPNPFAFPPVDQVRAGSVQTSAAVMVSGINTGAPIAVAGGEYSLNGGAFVGSPGQIRPGDSVQVRQTASAALLTSTRLVLTIGGVSADWMVTTSALDDTPEPLNFGVTRNFGPGNVATSEQATVSGINGPAEVSIVGGSFSIDGGPYSAEARRVVAGSRLRIRMTASENFETTTSAFLTVGGLVARYRVSTVAYDKQLDSLLFASVADVVPGQRVISNAVLVEGINPDAPVSVAGVGAEYSIDGGPFTRVDGVMSSGASLRVRSLIGDGQTSATAVAYVGNRVGTFVLSTLPTDTTPNAYTLRERLDVPAGASASASTVVYGITAAAAISISGGEYAIGTGAFTTAPGLISEGQKVKVRLTAPSTYSSAKDLQLTIGGLTETFHAVTSPYPRPLLAPPNNFYQSVPPLSFRLPPDTPVAARVYYTLDRTTPTLASIPYVAPFTLGDSALVNAALISPDGLISGPMISKNFSIYTLLSGTDFEVAPGVDLNLWKIGLPIGRFATVLEVLPPFLGRGYSNPPYFVPNADGSLDFFAPVTGQRSPNSSYPRSELREMNADGSEASWQIGDQEQELTAELTVTRAPGNGRMIIGQIHADDDGPVQTVLEWQGVEGRPGTVHVSTRIHPDDDASERFVLASEIPWGSRFRYRIKVGLDDVVTVTIAGPGIGVKAAAVRISPAWRTLRQYFKAGVYVQDNVGTDAEGGGARFHGIRIRPTIQR